MPTTDPSPEWDWYSNTDLKLGDSRFQPHPWELTDEEIEEWQKEAKLKESRRAAYFGFSLPSPDISPNLTEGSTNSPRKRSESKVRRGSPSASGGRRRVRKSESSS